MKQPATRFLDTSCTKEQVASVFAISTDDIEPELLIRAIDTGLGHLIVPLRSLDALFCVKRQTELLRQLCSAVKVREALLFCFEVVDETSDIHARNICPGEGLEDPACGVGNGALAAYLSQFCWTTKADITLKIEQGTIVQRPSLIHTRTARRKETIDVFISGAGAVMQEGRFLV